MMAVLISSTGICWTFYSLQGDKLFMVEAKTPHPDLDLKGIQHMVRECRWMFGDRRIVYMNRDGHWMEVLHDGAGNFKGYEPYDGPIPVQEEIYYE